MDKHMKGWFTEMNDMWPGQAMAMQVDEILHHEKSQYQDILVFKSKVYNHVLALDEVVQFTDQDEWAYHEMAAHIPLCSHPNPRSVLVVGGGDGGVLREVAKHKTVEEIHICEIDERVIEVSKRYLPQTAVGFSSPKVKVHIQDGAEFMQQCVGQFDVIITDSSDPIGPAKSLFEKPYFEKMKAALRPGGLICSMGGECQWGDLPFIKRMMTVCQSLFPVVSYAFTTMPSYCGGQIGFVLASLNKDTVFEDPLRRLSEEEQEEMGLQYYDSDVHKASFTLPRFARKELEFSH